MNWDDVELVTFDQALQHGRLPEGEEDEDLQFKLRQAHEIVLDHISREDDEEWTATMLAWTTESAPRVVQAAILRQFLDLVRFRGDDESGGDGLGLSPYVRQLLQRYHDWAIA